MNTLCPSCFLDQDGGEDDDERHDADNNNNNNNKRKGDAGDKESKTDKD